ncbi:MAG: M28 family peptidase [Anaerolineae bacterium]
MTRRLSLFAIVLTLVLTTGLVPAAATPAGAGAPSEPTALVAIYWHGDADLAAVEAAGVPVYARLTGADGRPYLLAGVAAADLATLERSELQATVLDASPAGIQHAGADYLLATVMPGQAQPAWSAYGRLLLDDGQRVLLRAEPGAAQRLAEEGVHVQGLSLMPKPLRSAVQGTLPDSVVPHPRVQAIIDQVKRSTVYQYTGDLSGEWPAQVGGAPYTIATRNTYSGTPVQKATEYAGDYLSARGLDVEYHTWQSGRPPNVIGELTSYSNPDEILMICGHLDDMPSGSVAPGADDNASGSVAVLLAADLFSQYPWTCSLRFALWTGEEQGLLGSAAYAQRAYARGENIQGVLNLDMIAYNTGGSTPGIDLHADQADVPQSMVLAQLFADVVTAYGLDLVPEIVASGSGASDHASFWDYGFTSILGIEDFSDFNPYYHTTNDLLANTDLTYYTEFVKAASGAT